jgi:hypothetical protein
VSQEFEWNVVEDVTPPTVSGVEVLGGRLLLVNFSSAVVESEALDPANYSFDNGLVVLGLEKVGGSQYQITTSLQTPGLSYELTVTGIHDLNGNLI